MRCLICKFKIFLVVFKAEASVEYGSSSLGQFKIELNNSEESESKEFNHRIETSGSICS